MADITIIIPTKNRLHYIKRVLEYYGRIGWMGPIIVGDSSDPGQKLILPPGGRDIMLFHDPALGVDAMVRRLLDFVHTPYVMYHGDDDFGIPAGINAAVRFLKSHADYAACSGRAVARNDKEVWQYHLAHLEQDDPIARLEAHAHSFQTSAFSVHPTVRLAQSYRFIPETGQAPVEEVEFMPSIFTVAAGKIGMVPELFLVREFGPNRGADKFPTLVDWFMRPHYTTEQENFCRKIDNALKREIAFKLLHARNIDRLNAFVKKRNPPKFRAFLRKWIPGLHCAYRKCSTWNTMGNYAKAIKECY